MHGTHAISTAVPRIWATTCLAAGMLLALAGNANAAGSSLYADGLHISTLSLIHI